MFIVTIIVKIMIIMMRYYYYSWTQLCRTRLSRTPHYLEQNWISLGFALGFSVIHYGLSRTRLSRTPRYLEQFLSPHSSNRPRLPRTLLRSEETRVNWSVRKCSQGESRHLLTRCTESWQMYWRVRGKREQTQTDWTWSNYYSRNLTPTSLSRTPAISNYFSIPLRVRDSGVLLYYS